MFEMNVPYDKGTMKISLPEKNLAGVLEGKQSEYTTELSEKELVEQSLDNPIGSKSLEELAKGKKDIVIISSDHTRPVPSKIITPILLRRIRSVSPDARIRILVATGFHRPSTHEELVDKYGEEIVANEEIVMHISTDDASMKKIGVFICLVLLSFKNLVFIFSLFVIHLLLLHLISPTIFFGTGTSFFSCT